MGYMLFLGVMMWTVLALSAIHVACASEAASAVTSLQCTGSACGTETVRYRWRSFTNRGLVTRRRMLFVSEFSSSESDNHLEGTDEGGNMVFAEDYSVKSPPPPKRVGTPVGPSPRRGPIAPPSAMLSAGAPGSERQSQTTSDFEPPPPPQLLVSPPGFPPPRTSQTGAP